MGPGCKRKYLHAVYVYSFVITYIVYINMIRGSQLFFVCLSFPCPYPYPYPCRSQPPFGTVVIPASGRTATWESHWDSAYRVRSSVSRMPGFNLESVKKSLWEKKDWAIWERKEYKQNTGLTATIHLGVGWHLQSVFLFLFIFTTKFNANLGSMHIYIYLHFRNHCMNWWHQKLIRERRNIVCFDPLDIWVIINHTCTDLLLDDVVSNSCITTMKIDNLRTCSPTLWLHGHVFFSHTRPVLEIWSVLPPTIYVHDETFQRRGLGEMVCLLLGLCKSQTQYGLRWRFKNAMDDMFKPYLLKNN